MLAILECSLSSIRKRRDQKVLTCVWKNSDSSNFKKMKMMYLFIFYVCECFARVYVYTLHAQGCQKRALDALEQELQVVVSCYVDAQNELRFLLKSNLCS